MRAETLALLGLMLAAPAARGQSFVIVDTGQNGCYSDLAAIGCPLEGEAFYGQDAQYDGVQPRYQDNGDGTVTDLNTGLMWQQSPDTDKSTYAEALAAVAGFDLAGYDDWRLPTIKELYSLIDFNGRTGTSAATSVPYIDTSSFDFFYGDESSGERFIDAQGLSKTEYVGTTMGGDPTVFGVNFADGRIKGYPRDPIGPPGNQFSMTFVVHHVRGATDYGLNSFADNGNGTITDAATGLMWTTSDSGGGLIWEDAFAYCEDLTLVGHNDWRLPNAKELQGIVDYTRAPDAADPAMQSAAIDPVFGVTSEESFFWTGTTHLDGPQAETWAVYVAFGQAWGYMEMPPGSGNYQYVNVHGAGAQRSDPKSGDPANWPNGNGPQGDEVRIYNYARCVRTPGLTPINILRFETIVSLAAASPETSFLDVLPWLDPDDVLEAGAPPLLYYQVTELDRIMLLKNDTTIRIEAH